MTQEVLELPVEKVYGNPDQPRQDFDQGYLEDLAASIKANGVLQPIKVTQRGDGYMIVMGECRWRASKIAGLPTIRAVIGEAMSDLDVMVEAIVENGIRRDVKPLEEAVAYQRCLDQGMTVDELAARVGLQQAWRVTERTCLLSLRPEYQQLSRSGQLGNSQAYEMAQLSPAGQDRLFKAIRMGECPTYAALRSMALVIRDSEREVSFLDDEGPTANERTLAKSLERRFAQVAAVLRASTVDNEVVAVKKVDPTRAGTLADLMAAMQGDLRRIELALRASATAEAA
jgi:ParB/RepB/Spo0J family partition protein